jgi:hypothetical protein
MLAIGSEFVSRLEVFLETAAFDRRWAVRRDALAVSLGLCGLRWEEVHRVRMRDVDVATGRLLVESAKGGLRRVLPLGSPLLGRIQDLVNGRPSLCRGVAVSDGFAFVSGTGKRLAYEAVVRRLRGWCWALFGRAYSFHCLRHTAAVRVYEATRDVLVVQRFLGHTSLQWTETYLRSLLTVEVSGLPAFCGGVPRLRVVGTGGQLGTGDEEEAADSEGNGDGEGDAPNCCGPGDAEQLSAEELKGGKNRRENAVRVGEKNGRGGGAIGSVDWRRSSGSANGVGFFSVGSALSHDCLESTERVFVPGPERHWKFTCRVCGRFVGNGAVQNGVLPGQRDLFGK